MCLSGKVSSVIMPDMYANVVCFACLDRINQHSSVEKRSKREFSAREPPMSLDLTPTVFLNVIFHGVILEHCDMVQMTVTVPSQPFNEPVCLFVCVFMSCDVPLYCLPVGLNEICVLFWQGQTFASSFTCTVFIITCRLLDRTRIKTKQCHKPADDPQSIKINTLDPFTACY